jgi:hypothetical protein
MCVCARAHMHFARVHVHCACVLACMCARVQLCVCASARVRACVRAQAQRDLCLGHAVTGEAAEPMRATHRLQIASLSKTVAAAFLCEYVRANGLSLDETVYSPFATQPTQTLNNGA